MRAHRRFLVGPAQRRIPWTALASGAAFAAVGFYLVDAFWSTTRVDVKAEGIVDGSAVPSRTLTDATVRFTVEPHERIDRAMLRLDGEALPDAAWDIEGNSVLWRPGRLAQGEHAVRLTVPRPFLGDARFDWTFAVDDTPPRLDIPALLPPVGVCDSLTVQGAVERGATLTVDGTAVSHRGTFTIRRDRVPTTPLRLVATDRAGNRTETEVIAPVKYPGGQGVHVTAAAWNFEPLRRGVLNLIDSGLVSSVELDLKDEGGIIGYDSKVPLAQSVGAVRTEYVLRDAVAELKRRNVRVVGRIVAFLDPQLARWAWANDRRDWVVQTRAGAALGGGFTNHTHPDVRQYNLDIALEAVGAGVDDILWDYVRRPEGDPEAMVIPGLKGKSADSVVEFLAASRAALRERCAFQGASVFGIAADRPDTVGQDVPRIARNVDYIAPMLYPSHWVPGEYNVRNPNAQPGDIVRAALADFQEKAKGTGVSFVLWVQDFSLGVAYGPAEVRAQIEAAAQLGVSDWLLWNPGVRYTTGALSPSLVRPKG